MPSPRPSISSVVLQVKASVTVLLGASDDGYIRISDVRTDKQVASYKFNTESHIEGFSQDPFKLTEIVACFEDGSIQGIDMRGTSAKPLFQTSVSSKAVTSVSHNAKYQGMICTTGLDGTMNVFSTRSFDAAGKPVFVTREFANQVGQPNSRASSLEAASIRTRSCCTAAAAARASSSFGRWRRTRRSSPPSA